MLRHRGCHGMEGAQASSAQPSPNPAAHRDNWRDFIISLYPYALQSVYCVPALHFNLVSYRQEVVPGTNVKTYVVVDLLTEKLPPKNAKRKRACCRKKRSTGDIQGDASASPCTLWSSEPLPKEPLKNVLESDLNGDRAQKHVVANLQALGNDQKEPMFILRSFLFYHYLDKLPRCAQAQLPLPADLNTDKTNFSQFEADVLIFHRRYGVLVAEVKSVGRWHAANEKDGDLDEDIVKRIKKSLQQLQNSDKVLSHLVSDVAKGLTIRKTLCLPYVNRERLTSVLDNHRDLSEAFVSCMGGENQSEAITMCLCADQLSDPDNYRHVTPAVLIQLSTWWRLRMVKEDPLLCGEGGDMLYLDIVARFVGPATTVNVHCIIPPRVEVRTAGQAAAELGRRLSRLVLTQQQLEILKEDAPMLCVTGPPGTGKTVLLVLKALQQLQQGVDVHIVSTRPSTVAASFMIQRQLEVTMNDTEAVAQATPPGEVYVHHYAFHEAETELEKAVDDLTRCFTGAPLCVIMDEVAFHDEIASGPRNARLVRTLQERINAARKSHNNNISDIAHTLDENDTAVCCSETSGGPLLRLWCACITPEKLPDFLQHVTVTVPLRATPTIVNEIRTGMSQYAGVPEYNMSVGLPAPGDGPPVVSLTHQDGHADHAGPWPVDCRYCGKLLACKFRELGVGSDAGLPFRWRDVFIVTRSCHLRGSEFKDKGGRRTEVSPLVAGLQEAGVPVTVLTNDDYESDRPLWMSKVASIARAEQDAVTVANLSVIQGLERPVVAWMAGRDGQLDERRSPEQVEARDRLFIFSRCTTQLLTVNVPRQMVAQNSTEQESSAWLTTPIPRPAELRPSASPCKTCHSVQQQVP